MKTINTLAVIGLVMTFNILLAQKIQPLNVGDNAPDLSVYKWVKGAPVLGWRQDQYYMVEFGATWCTPCAAAIPELTRIQNEFKGDLSVISLFVMEKNLEPLDTQNPQYVAKVERYISKRDALIGYTVGVDNPMGDLENKWIRSAGREGVPHIFLLDKNAIIRWVGSDPKKARAAYLALIENKFESNSLAGIAPAKQKYDPSKLLLIGNNGGNESDFLFRSVLTRYDGKISGNSALHIENAFQYKPDSVYDKYEDKLEVIGAPLAQLYYMAYADTLSNRVPMRYEKKYADTLQMPYLKTSYGKFWHEAILEVKDKTPFDFTRKSTLHRFNYSLKVPKGMGTAFFLQRCMQHDLDTYFGYKVTVETRSMPYWRLNAPDKSKAIARLKSKNQSLKFSRENEERYFNFRNAIMFDIVSMMAMNYGYVELDYGKLPKSEQAAFIDETGITDKIDFDFDENWTFDQAKAALKEMGLELTKGFRQIKVVVIRD